MLVSFVFVFCKMSTGRESPVTSEQGQCRFKGIVMLCAKLEGNQGQVKVQEKGHPG